MRFDVVMDVTMVVFWSKTLSLFGHEVGDHVGGGNKLRGYLAKLRLAHRIARTLALGP
jgi:hypothetical protein